MLIASASAKPLATNEKKCGLTSTILNCVGIRQQKYEKGLIRYHLWHANCSIL